MTLSNLLLGGGANLEGPMNSDGDDADDVDMRLKVEETITDDVENKLLTMNW